MLTFIKTCPTTEQQCNITKKKTPIKKSHILSNIISNNIYKNLHHFNNNIIVQLDNGNTKTKQIQCTQNICISQSSHSKSEEISSPSKLFHGVSFSFFPGTCVSQRFYSNLISKTRSHLIFRVRLFFYVLFLGLIFRKYLFSPKSNINIIQNIYI